MPLLKELYVTNREDIYIHKQELVKESMEEEIMTQEMKKRENIMAEIEEEEMNWIIHRL